MLMTDLICKKRDKEELTTEEINFMISGLVDGSVPDYQMSAMTMAILLNGMTRRETTDLTLAMMHSGDTLNLDDIAGIKADKHSTGGVGDKTSLVLCPMVASCGIKIAKMSGRGLGHTGGTIDKLESFPGFNTALDDAEFKQIVNTTGIAITGQSGNLDPADKKLYALRDVTGTVPSIPLIVSSIMSKKLAAGADIIVLDVKCGDGSFMKTIDDAAELADNLIAIGKDAGRKCAAVISDMDQPLGYAIGNALEVREAISVLKGEQKGDLLELCLVIGAKMLSLAGIVDSDDEARKILLDSISSGAALNKLADMVEAQGGCREDVFLPSRLPLAPVVIDVLSEREGFVSKIDSEKIGLVSMHLGGGRATKDSVIDLGVGIVLNKKVSDFVGKGETLARIYASSEESARDAEKQLAECYHLTEQPIERQSFIKKIVG